MLKKIALGVTAAAAVAATLVTPAQALTCYTVAFDNTPNAWAQANPPRVTVDDGNPHVESYPC